MEVAIASCHCRQHLCHTPLWLRWGSSRKGKASTNLISVGRRAHIDDVLLLEPYPQRQEAVEDGVEDDGRGRVVLCVVEAELVVPGEAGCGDEEGAVAERKPDVREVVRLLELE